MQWTGIESLAGTVLLAFLLASLFFYRKQEAAKAFLSLCLGIGVLISTSLFFFINKVEAYSQNAAIEFLKGLANKNALVETYGYKSYAHLFYTQKQDNKSYHDWLKKNHPDSIPQNPKMKIAFMDALFTGEAVFDKEVYFITKITKVQEISRFTLLKKVAEKNGFVLLKRELPLPVNEFASDSIYNTMNIETIHF